MKLRRGIIKTNSLNMDYDNYGNVIRSNYELFLKGKILIPTLKMSATVAEFLGFDTMHTLLLDETKN